MKMFVSSLSLLAVVKGLFAFNSLQEDSKLQEKGVSYSGED